ncbi:hypothetical protein [Acetobacter aceti]|uniref:NERD domain-containing protein n=1 Tax=Acetobacter aceti TaxID=435 RepID=A0A6S6PDZ3_ACEAC|nr:hypothetical protein [Acetobacter aceti]BCI65938.1 hypothetical protein AAJCM20276_05620 [Acetobacter aceti]
MPFGSGKAPDVILSAAEGTWHSGDVRRLTKLARIAAATGDMADEVARAIERLAMKARQGRFVDCEEADLWVAALRWAIDDLASNTRFLPDPGLTTRDHEVGAAGVRLRKAGYPVEVGADGCRIAEEHRRELLRRIDGLVSYLGGAEVLQQLFRILDEQGRFEDGMWLLGDIVPPMGQRKDPTIPYGWLFTLALKHVKPVAKLRKPEVEWDNLVKLSRDYAALVDVERYDNLPRIDVDSAELIPTLVEALGWHQLFTFPRYRSTVVLQFVQAMREELDAAQWRAFGVQPTTLALELSTLFEMASAKAPMTMHRAEAERRLPNLLRLASARQGGVNEKFVDPFQAEARTSDGVILFEMGDKYLILPETVVAAQAATMLMTRIWRCLEDEVAKKAVGAICERVVTSICAMFPGVSVATDLVYHVGKQRFQIDVMATEDDEITLLEVKSKSLTKMALSGDMAQYLLDFDTSYLAMLKQLVRHETHLRGGNAELPSIAAGSRITKVAVSPLTYGPLSDVHLSQSILLGLFRVTLHTSVPNDRDAKILANLAKDVNSIGRSLENFVGQRSGQYRDVRVALMDYQWLDMAQLDAVVRLKAGVSAAFKILRQVSFASHDFWHEVALQSRLERGIANATASGKMRARQVR